MGVYGMLALALLVFCTRYLARPEDWSEGLIRYAFWATNLGLMLMILGHLFPLGVLQLGDVVTNGYWHARTEWFKNYPLLSWARLPGDLLFISGSAPLAWLSTKVALRTRRAPAPVDASGASIETTLYTEVLPTGAGARTGPESGRRRDETGGPRVMPQLTTWGISIDLGLVLLLGYLILLWGGGWVLEYLARVHFHRAQRYAHRGFVYDAELDRYECPQGELLTLETFDDRNKLAIYRRGLVVQRLHAQGVLHPARRGPARLPLAGRVPRDRRRPVPPPAVASDPLGRAGVRRRRPDHLVEPGRRVAARDRDRHQPGPALARRPRPPRVAPQGRGMGEASDEWWLLGSRPPDC